MRTVSKEEVKNWPAPNSCETKSNVIHSRRVSELLLKFSNICVFRQGFFFYFLFHIQEMTNFQNVQTPGFWHCHHGVSPASWQAGDIQGDWVFPPCQQWPVEGNPTKQGKIVMVILVVTGILGMGKNPRHCNGRCVFFVKVAWEIP